VVIRGRLALVPQEPWLFNASLKDNVLFGQPMDQERYEEALRNSHLLADTKLFPAGDGYEIGERGVNLSGTIPFISLSLAGRLVLCLTRL